MKKLLIPFSETHRFSTIVDDYFSGNDKLRPFYRHLPVAQSFNEVIKAKQSQPVSRDVLADVLLSQYLPLADTDDHAVVSKAIDSLRDSKTFTVTTGHQLNIFTGPLYSIYKIVSTIKLARQLSADHPDYRFVPVFWMATEDHDFEEINHIQLFGKKLTWEHPHGGAAGRLDTTGLSVLCEEIKSLLRENQELIGVFEKAYTSGNSLADATRKIMHHFFGSYGLVIIDADHPDLKALFKKEMVADIFDNTPFKCVSKTSEKMGAFYKIQVQPREINHFYLDGGIRERIVASGDGNFEVLNTGLRFTKDEMRELIELHPEKLSPNVVMRPLYQEKILPNLAYIGGPGELNYWFQYGDLFEALAIPFPVLMLRNCFLWLDKQVMAKLRKLGVDPLSVFKSTETLLLEILEKSSDVSLSTEKLQEAIQEHFADLASRLSRVDATLVTTVESEKQKFINAVAVIEEKARRALKKRNETQVTQLKSIKDKLFPDDGLQERFDNIIPYLAQYGMGFIQSVYECADPFPDHFGVIIDDESIKN